MTDETSLRARSRRHYRARGHAPARASPSDDTPGGRHTYCPSAGRIDSRMRVSRCHKIADSVISEATR